MTICKGHVNYFIVKSKSGWLSQQENIITPLDGDKWMYFEGHFHFDTKAALSNQKCRKTMLWITTPI